MMKKARKLGAVHARAATYRACPIKSARRSKAAIAEIRKAIYAIIRDDPPMTVRQTFYQLVARGVIEKTEEEYQGTVIRLMTEMRLDVGSHFHGSSMRPAACA